MYLRAAVYIWLGLLSAVPTVAAAEPEVRIITPQAYSKILDYLLISPSDVKLYKKIFRATSQGDFDKAADLADDLENNILLGHVEAEKYLHADYQASYEELQNWLKQYSDLPQAGRIYKLAQRKGSSENLTPPNQGDDSQLIRGWKNADIAKRSPAEKQYLLIQVTKFRRELNQGRTRSARRVLEQPRFRKLAPDKYWDELAASLAMKYFVDNYNQLAWQWAVKASRRRTSGMAPWVAGLSAWRMKNYANAAKYFKQLADSKNDDNWLVSAGAYWAYRSYSRLNNQPAAKKMLLRAAQYPHTFYGILGTFKAGRPLNYNWDSSAYLSNFDNLNYVYDLLASPAIRRAVILIHAKRPDLAEDELRYAFESMTPKQQEAAIFIAGQYKMHALAIYCCKQIGGGQSAYNRLAYPIPEWASRGPWRVEKALVLGLIRQESSFKVDARSAAGARGLMQLMPNTAFHITKDRSIKTDSSRLENADYNLELGQRYVEYLLSKPFINGNLFFLMAAYNAGPSNLVKWQKNTKYGDDPLMFIEAVPSAETRIYIERVTANYWIYNSRFGIPSPTLEQVAAGKWPMLGKF